MEEHMNDSKNYDSYMERYKTLETELFEKITTPSSIERLKEKITEMAGFACELHVAVDSEKKEISVESNDLTESNPIIAAAWKDFKLCGKSSIESYFYDKDGHLKTKYDIRWSEVDDTKDPKTVIFICIRYEYHHHGGGNNMANIGFIKFMDGELTYNSDREKYAKHWCELETTVFEETCGD